MWCDKKNTAIYFLLTNIKITNTFLNISPLQSIHSSCHTPTLLTLFEATFERL